MYINAWSRSHARLLKQTGTDVIYLQYPFGCFNFCCNIVIYERCFFLHLGVAVGINPFALQFVTRYLAKTIQTTLDVNVDEGNTIHLTYVSLINMQLFLFAPVTIGRWPRCTVTIVCNRLFGPRLCRSIKISVSLRLQEISSMYHWFQ